MKHVSAKGKVIDMAAMLQQNKDVKAVGNGSMNANGDVVDRYGNIVTTVQAKSRAARDAAKVEAESALSNVDDTIAEIEKDPSKIEKSRKTKTGKGGKYIEVTYEDGSIEAFPMESKDA